MAVFWDSVIVTVSIFMFPAPKGCTGNPRRSAREFANWRDRKQVSFSLFLMWRCDADVTFLSYLDSLYSDTVLRSMFGARQQYDDRDHIDWPICAIRGQPQLGLRCFISTTA